MATKKTARAPLNPADYTGDKLELGPDLDLDLEVFTLRDGTRLTEELAEQMAREAVADARRRNLIPGRKSLSGDGSHSPRVQFRVPESLLAAAEAKAAEEGISLSTLARDALAHYLAS